MKNIDLSQILIGSDFEMFLEDDNHKIISAIPIINGTKDNPEKTDKQGCCIQHDNILAECNVPPAKIEEADIFWENIQYVKDFILQRTKDKGLKLLCCPSAEVAEDQLDCPEAVEFGCDSSFNGWRDAEMNEKPHSNNPLLRSAGGHLHFSFPNCDYDTVISLVKLCDLFLGVPFVLIDKDKRRRELYGKAGEFRFQSWGNVSGFEYRVLSNCWVEDKDLVQYVFDQVKSLFTFYNEVGPGVIDQDADLIVEAINEGNEALAEELCEKWGVKTLQLV